jgi:hypothetical protein
MNLSFGRYVLPLVAVLAIAAPASAQQTQINLDAYTDGDLTTATGGSGYPQNGDPITIGGINFDLPVFLGTGRTGFESNGSIILLGLSDISKAYTIINSFTGTFGANSGQLIFTNMLGQELSFDLIQGTNIRDHFNGNFNNQATGLFATQSFGTGVRYDVQEFALPADFSSLASVRLVSSGSGGTPILQGLTFLGVSQGAVPEPATWAMMIGGFGVVGGAMRSARPRQKSLSPSLRLNLSAKRTPLVERLAAFCCLSVRLPPLPA